MTPRKAPLGRERSEIEATESGFTLIELLIVIVVLGILAAIVVFALGSTTGNAVVSACSSDARTVDIAAQALMTEHPLLSPATSLEFQNDLVQGVGDGPYVQTWPGTTNGYTISVGVAGDAQVLSGSDSSDTIQMGDVLVDVTQGTKQGLYDYTQDAAACSNITTS